MTMRTRLRSPVVAS